MSSKPDGHGGATVVKRRGGRHGDHGHGGAWKVAFADFCLALLCLFLVMWLLASREQEKTAEALRAAGGAVLSDNAGGDGQIGGPRGSLIERHPVPAQGDTLTDRKARTNGQSAVLDGGVPRLSKTRLETPADMRELAGELQRLSQEAGLAANMHAVITPQGLRVLLHDTDRQGMFERGSAVPNERFRELLQKLGPLFALVENPLLVVGHTDATPYIDNSHTAFSNWTLSGDRALAARTHLLIGGMPVERVLQVVGMADRAPFDAQNPRAAVNRRIELLVMTSAQAASMASMFGMPGQTRALTDGVETVQPDAAPLSALRGQLQQAVDGAAARQAPQGR